MRTLILGLSLFATGCVASRAEQPEPVAEGVPVSSFEAERILPPEPLALAEIEQLDAATRQLNRAQSQVATLQSQLASRDSQVRSLQRQSGEMARLQAELQQARAELVAAQQELGQVRDRLSQKRREDRTMRADFANAMAFQRDLQARVVGQDRQLSQIQLELRRAEQRLASTAADNRALRAENTRLEGQASSGAVAAGQVQRLRQQLRAKNAENAKLLARLAQLESSMGAPGNASAPSNAGRPGSGRPSSGRPSGRPNRR